LEQHKKVIKQINTLVGNSKSFQRLKMLTFIT